VAGGQIGADPRWFAIGQADGKVVSSRVAVANTLDAVENWHFIRSNLVDDAGVECAGLLDEAGLSGAVSAGLGELDCPVIGGGNRDHPGRRAAGQQAVAQQVGAIGEIEEGLHGRPDCVSSSHHANVGDLSQHIQQGQKPDDRGNA
jgi:hypothetical protein